MKSRWVSKQQGCQLLTKELPLDGMMAVITSFDRRVLVRGAPQAEYLSQDKKRFVADPVTRWRIAEPLTFYKTVRDESGAGAE